MSAHVCLILRLFHWKSEKFFLEKLEKKSYSLSFCTFCLLCFVDSRIRDFRLENSRGSLRKPKRKKGWKKESPNFICRLFIYFIQQSLSSQHEEDPGEYICEDSNSRLLFLQSLPSLKRQARKTLRRGRKE